MNLQLINQLRSRPSKIYLSLVCICILVYWFTNHVIRYFLLLIPLILLVWIFRLQKNTNKLLWVLIFSLQSAVIISDIRVNCYNMSEINSSLFPELFLSGLSHSIIILVLLREKMQKRTIVLNEFYKFLPFEILSSIVFITVFVPYLPFSYLIPTVISFVILLTIKYLALRRKANKESYILVVQSIIFLLLLNYMWFTIQFITHSEIAFLILHLSCYFVIYSFPIGMSNNK